MIARFWDALFDYADNVKKSGDKERYEIVHDIEDLLQTAYDTGMDRKSAVLGWKPKTSIEKLVASIPDIEVFKDPSDGKLFWELGNRYFDYPEEVIMYLIDFRTNKVTNEINRFKAMFLEAISESVKEFKASSLFGEPHNIEVRKRGEEEII